MNDMKQSYEDFVYSKQFDAVVGLVLSLITICVLGLIMYFTEQPEERTIAASNEAVIPIEIVSDEIIEFEDEIEEAVAVIEETEEEEEVVVEPVAATPITYQTSYSCYVENGDGLTRSGGVNYHDGRRETWYSSSNPNSYHYRTGEWTVGEDGVYRDADGYVVVAASDLAQGSTVSTSFGEGKVYDTGCAAGTTDIYTAW